MKITISGHYITHDLLEITVMFIYFVRILSTLTRQISFSLKNSPL